MPRLPAETRYRRWGQQMLAEGALRELAPVFAAAAIPVVPVKGLALGRWVYSDPSERGLLDVDLLVSRERLADVRACIASAGFRLMHASELFGEVVFSVRDVVFEIHSSLGLQDLTGVEVPDVLARAQPDTETFACPVLRIDDLDHFTLVAANIVKDHFFRGQAHHRRDLELLWPRVEPHLNELIQRVEEAGFATGLYSVAAHMVLRGASEFEELRTRLAPKRRRAQSVALAYLRDHAAPRVVASALVSATNDKFTTRLRCMARLPLRAREVLGRERLKARPSSRASAPG